jgi:hypothetical protein
MVVFAHLTRLAHHPVDNIVDNPETIPKLTGYRWKKGVSVRGVQRDRECMTYRTGILPNQSLHPRASPRAREQRPISRTGTRPVSFALARRLE